MAECLSQTALAVTHNDGLGIEVEILDAQAEALHESQASTVDHLADESVRVIHRREEGCDFRPRKHDRHANALLRAADLGHPYRRVHSAAVRTGRR